MIVQPGKCPLTVIMEDAEFRGWFSHTIAQQDYIAVYDKKVWPIWNGLSKKEQGDILRLYVILQEAKLIVQTLLSGVPLINVSINRPIALSLNLAESIKDLIKGVLTK